MAEAYQYSNKKSARSYERDARNEKTPDIMGRTMINRIPLSVALPLRDAQSWTSSRLIAAWQFYMLEGGVLP